MRRSERAVSDACDRSRSPKSVLRGDPQIVRAGGVERWLALLRDERNLYGCAKEPIGCRERRNRYDSDVDSGLRRDCRERGSRALRVQFRITARRHDNVAVEIASTVDEHFSQSTVPPGRLYPRGSSRYRHAPNGRRAARSRDCSGVRHRHCRCGNDRCDWAHRTYRVWLSRDS
jgi:hypothetical protein